ncbi:hypothetical protein OMAG_000667, partial [Candidatus Omnitrophus magneticus]
MCLEGGVGSYDLSGIEEISDKEIRQGVAELYAREGILNGGEYARVMAGASYTLWGIEDTELYNKNLRVYRDFSASREEIEKIVQGLSRGIESAKEKILNENLKIFLEAKE